MNLNHRFYFIYSLIELPIIQFLDKLFTTGFFLERQYFFKKEFIYIFIYLDFTLASKSHNKIKPAITRFSRRLLVYPIFIIQFLQNGAFPIHVIII